ncbi:MAG: hypothetical protein ABFC80_05260, partial [Coriobacteriales bacterium]
MRDLYHEEPLTGPFRCGNDECEGGSCMDHCHGIMRKGGRKNLALIVAAALALSLVPGAAMGGWWRLSGPKLASSDSFGEPGNGDSYVPHISDDGRFVSFDSGAYNLSDLDANQVGEGYKDVYVRDMQSGECALVSETPSGALSPDRGARDNSISDDGRYVTLFTGRDMVPEDTNESQDLYVRDLATGEYIKATLGVDGASPGDEVWDCTISGDGRYVAFTSDEFILGLDDPSKHMADVFVWDVQSDETTLVSTTPTAAVERLRGARLAGISDDGRYVGFFTGRDFVPEDTNGNQDLYVKDMQTGEYVWARLTSDGSSPGSSLEDFEMSGDGSSIVFQSEDDLAPDDTNTRTDVYMWTRESNETTWVSAPSATALDTDRGSRSPTVSDDGQRVAFFSGVDFSSDDTNGEQDIYVKDMVTGVYTPVAVTADGSSPGSEINDLAMSGDGRYLAFAWSEGALKPTALGAAYYDPSASGG